MKATPDRYYRLCHRWFDSSNWLRKQQQREKGQKKSQNYENLQVRGNQGSCCTNTETHARTPYREPHATPTRARPQLRSSGIERKKKRPAAVVQAKQKQENSSRSKRTPATAKGSAAHAVSCRTHIASHRHLVNPHPSSHCRSTSQRHKLRNMVSGGDGQSSAVHSENAVHLNCPSASDLPAYSCTDRLCDCHSQKHDTLKKRH